MIRHGCCRHRPLLYRPATFKKNAADLSPTYKPKLRIISLQYPTPDGTPPVCLFLFLMLPHCVTHPLIEVTIQSLVTGCPQRGRRLVWSTFLTTLVWNKCINKEVTAVVLRFWIEPFRLKLSAITEINWLHSNTYSFHGSPVFPAHITPRAMIGVASKRSTTFWISLIENNG